MIINASACTIRLMAITLTQLTALLAVVRGGSVTAAADELMVTQPSVSSAIAALELGNRQYVFERVLSHSADVAISGRPPTDERLVAEPLTENEIVCVTAPGDPAAGPGPVEVADLAERVWLLREPGSGTRALGEQFLAERGLAPATLTLGS